MTNDLLSSGDDRSRASGLLPWVGVAIAFVVGLAGTITAVNTRREIRSLRAEIEDVRSTIPARAEEPARNLAGQMNRALEMVARRMNDTDVRLNELARRVADVAMQSPKTTAGALPPASAAPPASGEAPGIVSASPAAAARTYTVESGDTLGGIARKLGVSLTALQQANPDVNPARLKVGQKLNVP